MSRSPAAILYDAAGNPVGVVQEGSVYMLQAASIIKSSDGTKTVGVIDDATVPADKRLQVEADIKPGATIALAPGGSLSERIGGFLVDSGDSEDMVVDGDPTPVEFTFDALPTDDIVLTELRFVFSAESIVFEGDSFAEGNMLSNGIKVEAQVNNGTAPSELLGGGIRSNEDFLRLASSSGLNVLVDRIKGKGHVVVASYRFPQNERLIAVSGDFVRVTIQDDLTDDEYKVDYLTATLYGYKAT